MIPPLIVERALDAGLDLIAITDHNASANASAVIEAARQTGLRALPGMELQTREEVHLLCLFDTLEQLKTWQLQIDRALPGLVSIRQPRGAGFRGVGFPARRTQRPKKVAPLLGEQFVVDAAGNFVRREERLLLVSANITLDDAVARVNVLGGIAIPAHIDRPANGLIALLGFVPENLPVAALEISPNTSAQAARTRFGLRHDTALIRGSDAHWLDAIGRAVTEFEMEGTRCVESVAGALRTGQFVIRNS